MTEMAGPQLPPVTAAADDGRRPRLSATRLASETMLYGLAGGLGKALALVTVPILSRALGPGDYGLADLAIGFSALAATIVMFAGDIPAARLRGRAPSAVERRAIVTNWIGATVVTAIAAALVLLPFVDAIAASIWAAPGSGGLALLAIILIPVSATQAALANVLRIEGRPIASAGSAVVDLVAQLGFAIAFVLAGYGATGVVLGFIVGSSIGLVVAAVAAAPHFAADFRPALATRIVAAGLAFLPASIVFLGAEYVVRSAIATELGGPAVGQFAVAIRLASVMLLLSAAFSLAWGPHGLARQPGARTSRLFGAVLDLFTIAAVAASLVGGALAPEVVEIVSGAAFSRAAEALPGLLLAAALSGVFYVLVVAAGIEGRDRAVPIAALAGGATQVLVTLALLQPLEMSGVGLGAVAGRTVSCALLARATRGTTGRRLVAWATVVAAAFVVIGLQLAASDPATTLGIRLAAVVVIGLAILALWRRSIRPSLSILTDRPEPAPGEL